MTTYTVFDTNVATYLIVKGITMEKMVREGENIVFRFTQVDGIDDMVKDYQYRNAQVPAIQFATVSKTIRREISDMMKRGVTVKS